MSYALILDLVISVLLVATIVYAAILSRKLSLLRDAKTEMEALIATFTQATGKAESSLAAMREATETSFAELRASATDAEAALGRQIERARAVTDELSFLSERAATGAERLDRSISLSRGTASSATAPAPKRAAAADGSGEAHPARLPTQPAPWMKSSGLTLTASESPAAEISQSSTSPGKTALLKALQGMR